MCRKPKCDPKDRSTFGETVMLREHGVSQLTAATEGQRAGTVCCLLNALSKVSGALATNFL